MKLSANRAQLGIVFQKLEDLRGNGDGILGNEESSKGPDAFAQNPLSLAARSALSVGLSRKDEQEALQTFVCEMQTQWNAEAADKEVTQKMSGGSLYTLNKTLDMARVGLTPSDVREGFVRASGTVVGRDIATREIFYQRFEAQGEKSGKVMLISPGFQETGRDFFDMAAGLCKAGHTVVVMDHQWAGFSEGQKGGIDSGFGVARDVAQMAAFAQEVALAEFGDEGSVTLVGNSMGAGPGVLGAMALNERGHIDLHGARMPKALNALLIAPYLGATGSKTNSLLQAAAKVPMLNRIQAPLAGLPDLTDDKRSAHLAAQNAVLHDTRAQLSAFESVNDDIETLKIMLDAETLAQSNLTIVHSREDSLADFANSQRLSEILGASLHPVEGDHHVIHNEEEISELLGNLLN